MSTVQDEQFELARKAMEEEYRKNLEALERVKRFLPRELETSIDNGSHASAAKTTVIQKSSEDSEDKGQPVESPSLIGAVLEILVSKPATSFNPRTVLYALESKNFPFSRDNGKRILSVAQALRKLTERDQPQVKLVRRGSGRRPNSYRAQMQEINPAHVTTAARSSGMTM
jgi:hypothetical protein